MAARPPASTTNQPANTVSSSNQSNQPSRTGSATSSRIPIPITAPAGSITITKPPETSTSYFKLAPSNPITFAWNFTNVIVTPTHLTVHAACENGNTYPVGPTDGVIPGTATSVVWDIYSYQQNNPATPLAQAMYTLMVWDERGTAAPRLPGFMVPNENVKFAIYTPADYSSIDDGWHCTICNGSLSAYTSHPLFPALISTFLVIFLSGLSLFRFGGRDREMRQRT